jgi:hypothetical protein
VGPDTCRSAYDEKHMGKEKILWHQNPLMSKIQKNFKMYTITGGILTRELTGRTTCPAITQK